MGMVRSWMVKTEKEEITLIRVFGLLSREKGRKGLKTKVVKKEVSRGGHGDVEGDVQGDAEELDSEDLKEGSHTH